jgi:hypothetical protein
MTLTQLFDLIESEAVREQGQSAPVRAKRATVRRWLSEVIACPLDWRERVAAVPKAQGVDYALDLIKAATGKRPRLETAPPPPPTNLPLL